MTSIVFQDICKSLAVFTVHSNICHNQERMGTLYVLHRQVEDTFVGLLLVVVVPCSKVLDSGSQILQIQRQQQQVVVS